MNINLTDLIYKRPFQTRNADEFSDKNILEVFVDPTIGVSGPFEYGNEIIKGKMGTGKTMYLRANYIYYLSTLVPSLMEQAPIILPIYIKLSDFQNICDAKTIYNNIIIRLVYEILNTCKKLQSAEELFKLHTGIKKSYFDAWFNRTAQKDVLDKISKLSAEEYVEQISKELRTSGTLGNNFVSACGSYEKTDFIELKKKGVPQISDFVSTYDSLLRPINAKLLILFDEVGSINKSFFEENGNSSYFEILMNQLRTLDFVRTKIAIYPHTFADILTETRYGDIILLEDDIYTKDGYDAFLAKTITLIEKYLSTSAEENIIAENVFDISKENMQLIEQIIYASDGNMRRMVHLLDSTLDECYKRCQAKEKANIIDALSAMKKQASQMMRLYYGDDLDFLNTLTATCKKRSAYRFKFPNKSPILLKYTNKSSEYNIIKIKEIGSGRRGTTYWFDYSYCVYADIPTHYKYNSEAIARTRSFTEGDWITTVTKITDELLYQTQLPGKIEGTISYLNSERTAGFISDGQRDDIFFRADFVIDSDKQSILTTKRKVRFFLVPIDNSLTAREIELL